MSTETTPAALSSSESNGVTPHPSKDVDQRTDQQTAAASATHPPAEIIDITYSPPQKPSAAPTASLVGPSHPPSSQPAVATVGPVQTFGAVHHPSNAPPQSLGQRPYPHSGPPQQYGNIAPQPNHGLPHPYPPQTAPPPYVVHGQVPTLMDRCPRCSYVPPPGQSHLPLPPYGSHLPPTLYPPPQNWSQQYHHQAQPQYAPPPQPQAIRTPASVPQVPASEPPKKGGLFLVPPEFRNTRYFPKTGTQDPNTEEQGPSRQPEAAGDKQPTPSLEDFFPNGPHTHVSKPFIGPPKYAPVPTPEAVAATAPKWPKTDPRGAPDKSLEGLSRRERKKRLARKRLTRDQRRDVLLMRRLGYQFESIARFLGTTVTACQHTCKRGHPETMSKNAGRRVHVPPEKITQIIAYVKKYQAEEKAAGVDKKTGKRKMPMLNYKMIRQNVFVDENGQTPPQFKYTDEALKNLLNKNDLYLRQPMSNARKELGRVRGLQQWQDKLAKDRAEAQQKAAEAIAAGLPVSDELAARANGTATTEYPGPNEGGYAEAGEDDHDGSEDEDMDDAQSESDEDDDEGEDEEEDGEATQPMHIEDQLRQAMAAPHDYA